MWNKGYWLSYLINRRYTSMYIGLVFLLIAAVAMLTGKIPVVFHGIESRDDDPKRFLRSVAACAVLGLLSIGLSLFAFYLYGNSN